MNKPETEEIRQLRIYKEESGLSFDKLGRVLLIHSITIFNWFRGHQQPSDMAKRLIRAFLKKEGALNGKEK